MKKLILIALLFITGIAQAQIPAANDTTLITPNTPFTPQFRTSIFTSGGVNYRIPQVYNSLLGKYDTYITSKYLRAFYAPITGSTAYWQINYPNVSSGQQTITDGTYGLQLGYLSTYGGLWAKGLASKTTANAGLRLYNDGSTTLNAATGALLEISYNDIPKIAIDATETQLANKVKVLTAPTETNMPLRYQDSTLYVNHTRFNTLIGTATATAIAASSGTTTNPVAFNDGGAGASSPTTFNGSIARTISYNTIGAVPVGRLVSTGYGLSGGGDLGNNLTLLVDTGDITSKTFFNTRIGTATAAALATKGSGTVTSVAALTLGTTGTDLSSSVANGSTTPVITLNVPTASASNRGALSSTDWSTFNNKQSAITFGTGVQSALANNIGTSGSLVVLDGAGGTPSSISLTNATGTASGLTAGTVTTIGNLTGDVTSSNRATTLATVNSNVGSFGNATNVSTVTVNAKGLVTAASNTPIQIAESQVTNLTTDLAGKQATLVSGTNIKTVGSTSILGSGDIPFPTALPPSGSAGGDLTGSYPNPTVNTINSITKNYYDPTSSIQTQLNGKFSTSGGTITGMTALQYTAAEFQIKNDATNALILGNFDGTKQYIKSIDLGTALTPLSFQASDFDFNANVSVIGGISTSGLDNYNSDLSGSYTSRSKVDKAYVDGKIISGSYSTTASGQTTFTVTTGVTQPNNTYKVQVTPTSSLGIAFYYVTNKTTTTFDVVYSGTLTGTLSLDWTMLY